MLISGDTLAIAYGLSCAVVWGTGDFTGGLASKRTDAFGVVLFSQLVSVVPLIMLIVWVGEPLPDAGSCWFGALAGIFGAMGLIGFYRGLARGRMGLVAPLTAVLTALIPILYTLITRGIPYHSQLLGFVMAALAIWLLAAPGQAVSVTREEATLALAAGCGFGFFFIFIHHAGSELVLWPLMAARITSLALLSSGLLCFRRLLSPSIKEMPVIAATGILDMLGNALFILAAQAGRLDVSVVLSSLAPGGTVLLAWAILKERLSGQQWAGVMSALVAIGLIAW